MSCHPLKAGWISTSNYRELIVWQKGIDLVEAVYRSTGTFPAAELYGLTSQLRRSAVSVPANIAEGRGRGTPGELLHFLSIANGSLKELETHVIIAERLRLLSRPESRRVLRMAEEIGRMLGGLRKQLRVHPAS